ncbi:hypothetical protein Q8G71_34880, partial [Klebsiella pneumoniae]
AAKKNSSTSASDGGSIASDPVSIGSTLALLDDLFSVLMHAESDDFQGFVAGAARDQLGLDRLETRAHVAGI